MNEKWKIGRREFLAYSTALVFSPRILGPWAGFKEEVTVYEAVFFWKCTDAYYDPIGDPDENFCYVDEDGNENYHVIDRPHVYSACGKFFKVSTLFLGYPPPGLVSLCDSLPTAYLRKLNPLTFFSCPICGAGRWLVHSASLAGSTEAKLFRFEEILPAPFQVRFTPLRKISIVEFPESKKGDE